MSTTARIVLGREHGEPERVAVVSRYPTPKGERMKSYSVPAAIIAIMMITYALLMIGLMLLKLHEIAHYLELMVS